MIEEMNEYRRGGVEFHHQACPGIPGAWHCGWHLVGAL